MTCSICANNKSESEFNFRNSKIQIRYKHCKDCQKTLRKQSYRRNRKYYLQYAKDHDPLRKKNRRNFIIKYKEEKPCADCKLVYPYYVMDFDHLPQFKKEIRIASRGVFHSEETLLKEFRKCELVCSNCHRERTFKRKQGN